jgi:hypothetical protein
MASLWRQIQMQHGKNQLAHAQGMLSRSSEMKRAKSKRRIGYAAKLGADGEVEWTSIRTEPNSAVFVMLPARFNR